MVKHELIGISRHRIGVDGAGITTLVAYHGCPLRCKYCLNSRALNENGVWKSFTTLQLVKALQKDNLYFLATRGGVTFGGGEPLLSPERMFHFKQLCPKGWRINIETSLNVPRTNVEVLIPIIDHWIVDIKDMNPRIYEQYTGMGNNLVVDNLKRLVSAGAKVTVRVPLIPGYNTLDDVAHSIVQLKDMGITDIDQFTYIVNFLRHG